MPGKVSWRTWPKAGTERVERSLRGEWPGGQHSWGQGPRRTGHHFLEEASSPNEAFDFRGSFVPAALEGQKVTWTFLACRLSEEQRIKRQVVSGP